MRRGGAGADQKSAGADHKKRRGVSGAAPRRAWSSLGHRLVIAWIYDQRSTFDSKNFDGEFSVLTENFHF
jgi:hypothetical protein